MGWSVRLLFLFLILSLGSPAHCCSPELSRVTSWPELIHRKVYDRKGVRIYGRMAIIGKSVWFLTGWEEPILVARGEPLQIDEEVQMVGEDLVFTNCEVSLDP